MTGSYARKTNETAIVVKLSLNSEGRADVRTGIGFFDHMLSALARFGRMDLALNCEGDLYVDGHHTVEDCGICIGLALKEALGDKSGMRRVSHAYVPMDEALAFCALDACGRMYFRLDAPGLFGMVGDFDAQLTREFFLAVAHNAGLTLHMELKCGNTHHGIEALFKAFGRALCDAVADSGAVGALSTKGCL